ncbi:MAG: hypothetical protein OXG15_07230 [Gammaproteobacteria bacterium]|nr:hypothetical protein [Gammaproteobacteria bacterium]
MTDWNSVSVKTPPTLKPLVPADIRTHLNLGTADATDDYLNLLIDAAIAQVDGGADGIGYAMLAQTWLLTFDNFKWSSPIDLLGWPVNNLVSIKYAENEQSEIQTLNPNLYSLVKERTIAQVYPINTDGEWSYWPTDLDYRPGKVQVEYTLGAASAADVPADLKMALLMMIGKWFMAREGLVSMNLSEIPSGSTAILNKYRWGAAAA